MTNLRVFTFSPHWGLPSAGPFAIKLLAWLELAGIPYEQIIEDNPNKGPKGKNPWIELDGEPMGVGLAWRRTFEEHFHQVLEWELFVHPAGVAYIRQALVPQMPPVIGPLIFSMLSSKLQKQLYARGLARHTPDIIAAKGRADVDALSAFLGERPFLLGDQPHTADAAVFGLLAPMVYWPMQTPVASHAKSLGNIVGYCDRMRARCFGN
jgi:glutathione S-transferase